MRLLYLSIALALAVGANAMLSAEAASREPQVSKADAVRAKSAKRERAQFPNAESILKWINGYRQEPRPDWLPEAVHAMSATGLLQDLDTAGVYIGFTAGVLHDNPAKAEKYVIGMFPMPPEEQTLIVKAIAYSGLPDWKGLLKKVVERMPARRVLIEKYLFGKGETLQDMPLDSGPAALDTLWGYYFATGSQEPIRRILTTLPWSTEKSDINKLTIGSMAKWTLASNAARDKDVLDICRSEYETQPKEVRGVLHEVITAAESYETGRIRKDALAAIEELKRKGPTPKTTGWGLALQAAPTAIAVGCVAATALGQVEVGVPCLVSGVLSSAAAKYWGGGTSP